MKSTSFLCHVLVLLPGSQSESPRRCCVGEPLRSSWVSVHSVCLYSMGSCWKLS